MKFKSSYLIWLIPCLIWISIVVFLGFDGLYGQDAYEYARYTAALNDYFGGDKHPGDFFWPVNYPLIGSAVTFMMPAKYALLLISLFCLIGSLLLIKKCLKLFYPNQGETINLFLISTACFSPYFLRSGVLSMSDQMAAFFCLWTFYSVIKYTKTPAQKHLIYSCLGAGLAIGTRYPCAIFLFPIGLYLLKSVIKNEAWHQSLTGILILCLGLSGTYLLTGFNSEGLSEHGLLNGWSFFNFFSSEFQGFEGTMKHSVINLLYGVSSWIHPGYFGLGIILIPFIKKSHFKDPSLKILVVSILLYQLFLMGIPFQNMRFHLIVFPFIVILMFPAFLLLKDKFKPLLFRSGLLIFIMLQIGVFFYSFQQMYARNQLEKEVAQHIESNHRTPIIYGFSIDIALTQRLPNAEIRSLWVKEYSEFEKGSLVIFNVKAFEEQWKGKKPMINWHFLSKNYELTELKEFDDGWVLYEIK